MLSLVFIVLVLSCNCVIGSDQFPNETRIRAPARSIRSRVDCSCSTCKTVTNLEKGNNNILLRLLSYNNDIHAGKLFPWVATTNSDGKIQRTLRPMLTKRVPMPKLCNNHRSKQECSFELHSRSRSTQDSTSETQLLNLSMVLCSAVLPVFYILFISLQKHSYM